LGLGAPWLNFGLQLQSPDCYSNLWVFFHEYACEIGVIRSLVFGQKPGFQPQMHQNNFGGRALPGPSGGA